MRILFLTQLLPLPLDAGPKIRAYYVLRYLVQAGHDITLLCFARPGDAAENVRRLREICSSVETVLLTRSRLKDARHGFDSLFTSTPFLILRDRIGAMSRRLKILTDQRSFDALHVDQLWMAGYGMPCAGPVLRVLDQHNAVFVVLRRMAERQRNPLAKAILQLEASKLRLFERDACNRFDPVVWVTDEDKQALRATGNGCHGRDEVIPIAVDPCTRRPIERPRPFRVTFVGGMHWPPNAEGVSWFAERVWPKVAFAAPEAVLTVIGRGAPRNLPLPASASRVEITGYLPHIDGYLSETAVAIVPIRSGAGMRVKILDAWNSGVPVVSTSLGAEGIRTAPGEDLLLADQEDSFAECIVRVLRDPVLARRLSENGRVTAENRYDWRKVYQAWDRIYH